MSNNNTNDKQIEQVDHEQSDSEPELEGENCIGSLEPRIVITYTMAWGCEEWGQWEVHYNIETGEQEELYVNNTNGHHYKHGMKLFYHEDERDQLRIEANNFEHEDWHEMVHYN